MLLELWTDGACEPVNPGGTATFGWVLRGLPGHGDVTVSGLVGTGKGMTNNVAEWHAVVSGLKWLTAKAPGHDLAGATLIIRGDSLLVVNQLSGAWQCKSDVLRGYLDEAKRLLKDLGVPVRIDWIPREQNTQADALTQRAWERHHGRPFPVRQTRAGRTR